MDLSAILAWFSSVFSWLGTYIYNLLLYIPAFFYDALVSAILSVLSLLPSLSFLSTIQSFWDSLFGGTLGSVSSGLVYFLDLFNLNFGIAAILSAYLFRFLLRRIPLIG